MEELRELQIVRKQKKCAIKFKMIRRINYLLRIHPCNKGSKQRLLSFVVIISNYGCYFAQILKEQLEPEREWKRDRRKVVSKIWIEEEHGS